jgi:hypothetical protein
MKKHMPISGMRFLKGIACVVSFQEYGCLRCSLLRQMKSIVTTNTNAALTTRTLMDRVNPMSSSSVNC